MSLLWWKGHMCYLISFCFVFQISGEWMFGATLCDMWTTCDLLCCTASILHLLAIAWDRYIFVAKYVHFKRIALLFVIIIGTQYHFHFYRYWAVTQVNYIHQRNFRTIGTMILMIWLTSVIVSLAPLMGWKDEKFMERIEAGKCMVRIHSYYQSTRKYKRAVFLLWRSRIC